MEVQEAGTPQGQRLKKRVGLIYQLRLMRKVIRIVCYVNVGSDLGSHLLLQCFLNLSAEKNPMRNLLKIKFLVPSSTLLNGIQV